MVNSSYDQATLFSSSEYAKGHRGPWETPNHRVPMLGAGGLFCTAQDAARFVASHSTGLTPNGKPLMKPVLRDEMYTIQYPVEDQACGFGMGVLREPRYGTVVIYHPGGGMGYQTMHAWIPEYHLGAVVLLNQTAIRESVHMTLAFEALQGMLQVKAGSAPEVPPLPPANLPTISLDRQELLRLEGFYRHAENTIPVSEKDGILFLGGSQPLRPYTQKGFVSEAGTRITFHLDKDGKSQKMQILDRWGYTCYPLDHTNADPAGPGKPEWKQWTGIYSMVEDGLFFFTAVMIRNGYIFLTGWTGDAQLIEYQPGLFFTADGEAVFFEPEKMIYGNGAIHNREDDPCQATFALIDTNPDDRRLTQGALLRLSAAYSAVGENLKADALLALDERLHPNK